MLLPLAGRLPQGRVHDALVEEEEEGGAGGGGHRDVAGAEEDERRVPVGDQRDVGRDVPAGVDLAEGAGGGGPGVRARGRAGGF